MDDKKFASGKNFRTIFIEKNALQIDEQMKNRVVLFKIEVFGCGTSL